MPFIVGVRVQVGMFDPVLIQRMGSDGRVPWPDERPDFPLDFGCVPRPAMSRLALRLPGTVWLREGHPGTFCSWTDIAILRKDWGGVIILEDIQDVHDAHAAIDDRMDGIIMSNHGTSIARVGVLLCIIWPLCPASVVAWWADGTSHSIWARGERQIDGAVCSFSALRRSLHH